MKILFHGQGLDSDSWLAGIRRQLPDADARCWSRKLEADWQADYALLWHPPAELFQHQKALRALFNLGAGVDALLSLPGRPEEIPLIRLRNAGMDRWMSEYVLYGVLHFGRDFDRYRIQQQQRQWHPLQSRPRHSLNVGLLGLGAIGAEVATTLARQGYAVRGWSREPKSIDGIDTYAGRACLDAFLAGCDFIVNLLPATRDTRHLLDAARLAALPAGAVVISPGRGSTLDQDALLAALDAGHLRGAMLDVFAEEPLPAEHPLWSRPEVIVTPHIAAPTLVAEALEQIAADIEALEKGRFVPYVNVEKEY
ncbi:glyoxylate/hydroxypyruvate reductase A [Marinobacterium nitratireducens]|uniref:Glyoxylate/hydroxypyruvate reductase A n=1 Tax=Marinobacterium nitratireducens TaxID=518897 RepID=A0A918DUZ4_9GAMM|nr:glyoxylate/hydroxypyruvate reductase A [Marinobacterium nitratireducens]GGO83235.1 glyoxylate/hydroxypyruvate reductase A [Marinobacterium nitratireducens]